MSEHDVKDRQKDIDWVEGIKAREADQPRDPSKSVYWLNGWDTANSIMVACEIRTKFTSH